MHCHLVYKRIEVLQESKPSGTVSSQATTPMSRLGSENARPRRQTRRTLSQRPFYGYFGVDRDVSSSEDESESDDEEKDEDFESQGSVKDIAEYSRIRLLSGPSTRLTPARASEIKLSANGLEIQSEHPFDRFASFYSTRPFVFEGRLVRFTYFEAKIENMDDQLQDSA